DAAGSTSTKGNRASWRLSSDLLLSVGTRPTGRTAIPLSLTGAMFDHLRRWPGEFLRFRRRCNRHNPRNPTSLPSWPLALARPVGCDRRPPFVPDLGRLDRPAGPG